MITLDMIPSSRLPGYIAVNGIVGLRLDRLPNGRTIAAEVRRDELGEQVTPYLDLDADPALVVRQLAEKCGLPILAGVAAPAHEIRAYRARKHRETVNAEMRVKPEEKGGDEL